ncbi:MAG: coproporphyrinogen dehydrogenase HemZ, partial [Oscillospiraceae bacterium]
YFVSAEKIRLCCRIAKAQNPVISAITPKDFGLYISIPFCPSRCAYCSFVSQSIEKAQKLIEPYFSLLLEELGETAAIAGKAGLRLVSVYIGGGTPTTLNAAQLTTLIKTVQHEFDMTSCKEFTVEAGRPDTIDQEKLAAFRTCGVTRISINPQSLEDRVLQNIGRKHTAADVVNTYALAREEGIDNINMDLIAGLEGDTPETFMATVEKVLAMAPENITVHSLSLKRSA